MKTVMIKLPVLENGAKKIRQNVSSGTKYILSEGLIDGADLIPVELGGRLVAPTISINELGKTLLKASADGDVAELKVLLSKGAPFTVDWLGTSPLHFAAQNNHLETCEILLRAGISKDARTKVDRTPLHMAAYEGHVEIVKSLIKHGADIESRDLLGMTPLHWAVQNGYYNVVELLVLAGAQSHANKFNLKPIDIALQIDRHDIIEVLTNGSNDTSVATQNLVIQLAAESVENDSALSSPSTMPVETILMNDIDSSDLPYQGLTQNPEPSCLTTDESCTSENHVEEILPDAPSITDSTMKLLQDHGITMLPTHEENNILSSVMESGHSVVLTEVGKEVLNSVKQSEQPHKKIITMSSSQFLSMAENNSFVKQYKPLKLTTVPTVVRKVVLQKNKDSASISKTIMSPLHAVKEKKIRSRESILQELGEAKRTIEEYKIKLIKKEQEAERYKQQLRLLHGD